MLRLFCLKALGLSEWSWYLAADEAAAIRLFAYDTGCDAQETAQIHVWEYPLTEPGMLPSDGWCEREWQTRQTSGMNR